MCVSSTRGFHSRRGSPFSPSRSPTRPVRVVLLVATGAGLSSPSTPQVGEFPGVLSCPLCPSLHSSGDGDSRMALQF